MQEVKKSTPQLEIRNATCEELKTIMLSWAQAEDWIFHECDIQFQYSIDPNGFFLAITDGKPVACLSFVRHASPYAIIDFVLCLPEYRQRGIVKFLLTYVLEKCQAPGMVVGLDAIDEVHKIYEKFGFEKSCVIQSYRGTSIAQDIMIGNNETQYEELDVNRMTAELYQYDRKVSFYDRSKFFDNMHRIKEIKGIVAKSQGKVVGWGMLRPGYGAWRIAPLYADNVTVADQLLKQLVNMLEPNVQFELTIVEQNAPILEQHWGATYSFKKIAQMIRMYKDQYAFKHNFACVYSFADQCVLE